jgi:hypothetical protein
MVTIKKVANDFVFEVNGLHKLWAFKSQITVPADHILDVHQNKGPLSMWKGVKMPGTNIPFVFTAGTFYKNGKKTFWDVVKKDNSIVVELKDSSYSHLIIEVENPEAAIALLKN